MAKHPEDAFFEAVHVELGTALVDLAKSVDLATKRIAFRAELSATILDAEKVVDVASALRHAAMEMQDNITLAPKAGENATNTDAGDIMSKVEAACLSLTIAAG
jgi:hypothetical protein